MRLVLTGAEWDFLSLELNLYAESKYFKCIWFQGSKKKSILKEGNLVIYYNMSEPWGHYAKWKSQS